jgi:MoxR-like ATPase
MKIDYDQDLENTIRDEQALITSIFFEMEKVIIGQRHLLESLLLGLLANGHVLIQGIPGLAKTLATKTFSSIIQVRFQRVQFTPDMLPADLTGSPIYIQQTGTFTLNKGPLFTNILLADEINRAPAKVQSALLEVMEERQITIGDKSYTLDEPFMVLATQNPIEHEGTYDLPESQLDRFLLKARVTYPKRSDEQKILHTRAVTQTGHGVNKIIDPAHVLRMRGLVDKIYLDDRIEEYILNIIEATRYPDRYKLPDLKGIIEYGASPRAALNLVVAGKAHAFLAGRSYVTPQDVKAIGLDVLSHRVILNHRADAEGLTKEDVVQRILDRLEMP